MNSERFNKLIFDNKYSIIADECDNFPIYYRMIMVNIHLI